MHRFQRGEEPVNFPKIRQLYQNWQNFCVTSDHQRLAHALYHRQQHYCAYCETYLSSQEEGHIEHRERRSDNPSRTFDWCNLFFSCNSPDSCGKFKDNPSARITFRPEDIIDPTREDPLDFFQYDMYGGIFPRDDAHRHRAEETIRVFHLRDSIRLRHIRKNIAVTISAFLENHPSEEEMTEFLECLGPCSGISVYYSLLGRKMP